MEDNMPSVSFILPVFKVEKWIAASIESLINQTFQNWEAIFVIDGSPDKSMEIVSKYAAGDNRIKIFTQKNEGISSARNTGVANSSGDYLFFVDPDDCVTRDGIQTLIDVAERTHADVVFSDFVTFNDGTQQSSIPLEISNEFISVFGKFGETFDRNDIQDNYKFYHSIYFMVMWGKLFRRSKWQEIGIKAPTGVSMGEDFLAVKSMIFAAEKLSWSPVVVTMYRKRIGSATTSRSMNAFHIFSSYRFTVEVYDKLNLPYSEKMLMQEAFFIWFWQHLLYFAPQKSWLKFMREIQKIAADVDIEMINSFKNENLKRAVTVVRKKNFKSLVHSFYLYNSIFEINGKSKYRFLKFIYHSLPVKFKSLLLYLAKNLIPRNIRSLMKKYLIG